MDFDIKTGKNLITNNSMISRDNEKKYFVFVLMPFDKDFDDIYQLGIKEACIDCGAHSERVDEQIFQDSILKRIYSQIEIADVIIADMTGKNSNVFYEVGYAHALGKKVILLTKSANDIPFDLIHYRHIVYDGKISMLRKELTRHLKWVLEDNTPNLSLEMPRKINLDNYQYTVRLIYFPSRLEDAYKAQELLEAKGYFVSTIEAGSDIAGYKNYSSYIYFKENDYDRMLEVRSILNETFREPFSIFKAEGNRKDREIRVTLTEKYKKRKYLINKIFKRK